MYGRALGPGRFPPRLALQAGSFCALKVSISMGVSFQASLAAAACLAAPVLAMASQVTLTFSAPAGGGSGIESQFRCVVSDSTPGAATFRFSNEVGAPSSVMRIAFGRMTVLEGMGTLLQEGCSFVTSAPTGSSVMPFRASQLYNAEYGDNPASGLDCLSDRLEIRLSFAPGHTFNDLAAGLRKGSMQVAMGLPSTGGATQWFVNDPGDTVVPLPPAATAGAVVLGLLGLARLRRRFR